MTCSLRGWLALVILAFGTTSLAAAEPKLVVLLHSFGRDFKPWSDYGNAIRTELYRQSPSQLNIDEHSLVFSRFNNAANPENAFVDYLRAIYAIKQPDLIVSVGAPAAGFVQRHRDELFPATPMVMAATDYRDVHSLTDNDTAVTVFLDFRGAVEGILRVLPDTKNVVVVVGNRPNDRAWIDKWTKALKPLENRISFTLYDQLSFEEILKRAAALPPHTAIFWGTMTIDAAGVAHEAATALSRLYAVANAPIFSYNDATFGRETVGGPLVSTLETGLQTAKVSLRILNGEKAGDIRLPPIGLATPKYNWKELQRWGISETRLPPGSEIYFREPGMWQQYRSQIALAAGIILAQAGLISGLLFQRRRRLHAEVQARQRSAELAHLNRVSMAGELTATIAHELNQPLGAILANIETVQLMVKSPAPDLQVIGEIAGDIRRDDVRASEVIGRLRAQLKKSPLELKDIDLNDVARETVQFLSTTAAGREVDLTDVISPTPLPVKGDRIQLQQVTMNLIVNAMDAMSSMPSTARQVVVSTARDDNSACLSVSDVGPGIPVDRLADVFEPFFTTKDAGMGMGLSIARTIVEAHDGHLSAQNEAGRGATFRITLPLTKRAS